MVQRKKLETQSPLCLSILNSLANRLQICSSHQHILALSKGDEFRCFANDNLVFDLSRSHSFLNHQQELQLALNLLVLTEKSTDFGVSSPAYPIRVV